MFERNPFMTEEPNEIILFRSKKIRRQLHNGEWWFVIEDVVAAVAETSNPKQYLKNINRRDLEIASLFVSGESEGGVQLEPPLALPFRTTGGIQKLKSWNTTGILRLIQSIPSKNAEPFKRWLAKTPIRPCPPHPAHAKLNT